MKTLLLRGLTREQRHWGEFLGQMQRVFGAQKVFCLDHVGVGTESHRAPVYSIDQMVHDLRRRWLELRGESDERWTMVSLSLGSMVSLRWCEMFPDDFGAQVVMNVSSARSTYPWQRLLWGNFKNFAAMSQIRDTQSRERHVLDMCTNLLGEDRKDQLATEWAAFAPPKAALRRVALRQLFAAARFRAPTAVRAPTLALVSAADRLVDPRCTLIIAETLKIPCEIHPSAGHEMTLDDPEWVVARIQEFLKAG